MTRADLAGKFSQYEPAVIYEELNNLEHLRLVTIRGGDVQLTAIGHAWSKLHKEEVRIG